MKQALCNESLFATAGMENVLVRLARLLVDTEHRYRAAVFRWETLKSLQGHSLTPLSLTLSHTHTTNTGHSERASSIPNIPNGAWHPGLHQQRVARSSYTHDRPLNKTPTTS